MTTVTTETGLIPRGSGDAAAALARRRTARRRKAVRQVVWNALGLAIALVLFFPVYWSISTAFKPAQDILTFTPHWFPDHFTLFNFRSALGRPFFWDAMKSSVTITVSTILISSVIALLAAVAIGRMDFRGRKGFIIMIIVVQMIPPASMIISLYLMLNKVHLTDSYSGVVLVYIGAVLPFTVWTLRGFVVNVPKELEEAALVDGCGRFEAFRRVVFPLIMPGLVATSIFAFIQAWNEYIVAYVMLTDQKKQTLTVWLAYFTSQRGTEWGPLMAASVITAMPVVIFFMLINRKLASGLTAGAVKG